MANHNIKVPDRIGGLAKIDKPLSQCIASFVFQGHTDQFDGHPRASRCHPKGMNSLGSRMRLANPFETIPDTP